jgi:hypothetical protein
MQLQRTQVRWTTGLLHPRVCLSVCLSVYRFHFYH